MGVHLSKDLMTIAGLSLRANITTLGPLVLPFSEQLYFLAVFIARKVLLCHLSVYHSVLMVLFARCSPIQKLGSAPREVLHDDAQAS